MQQIKKALFILAGVAFSIYIIIVVISLNKNRVIGAQQSTSALTSIGLANTEIHEFTAPSSTSEASENSNITAKKLAASLAKTHLVYDLFSDPKAKAQFRKAWVNSGRAIDFSKISQNFEKNEILEVGPLSIPVEYSLIIQAKFGSKDGDLLGNRNCENSRILIHAPANGSVFAMLGHPRENTVRIPLQPQDLNSTFSIILSKEKTDDFIASFNSKFGKSHVGPDFKAEISSKIIVGNSGCHGDFKGQIYRFAIYSSALSEAEIGALTTIMKSSKFQACKSVDIVKCLL